MQPIKPEAFLPSGSEQDQQQQGDPYEQIIHLLSATRDNLDDISDGLARRQDEIGALRVAAYQKADTRLHADVLTDVCRVIAPESTEPESDPYYVDQAKAAILIARGGAPARAIMRTLENYRAYRATGEAQEEVWRVARQMWAEYAKDPWADADRTQEIPRPAEAGFRQQSAAEGMYAKVAAGEVIDRAQAAHDARGDCDGIMVTAHTAQADDGPYTRLLAAQAAYRDYRIEHPEQCAEARYDTRGDCDGRMWCGELNRPMNGLPAGTKVYLCVSHMRQAQAAGEVAAGAIPVDPDPAPEEVILREGVVVRSGDTLVVSYPEGTKATKVLADLRMLRAAMPEEARVTLVTGATLTVIRCDDGEV